MSAGNQKLRIDLPLETVTGPIIGDGLLESFKSEIAKEPVLAKMFGGGAKHVYVGDLPSVNETIMPAMVLSWKSENFKSMNTFLEGYLVGEIYLPTKLLGNYNALRRVASIIQRWMSTRMKIFTYTENKGLTMFGFGTDYSYEKLAVFSGVNCPMIQMNIPFRYDLSILRNDFDQTLPLDESDLGFIDFITANIINEENDLQLTSEKAVIDNG